MQANTDRSPRWPSGLVMIGKPRCRHELWNALKPSLVRMMKYGMPANSWLMYSEPGSSGLNFNACETRIHFC
jgi:hypothetical protein